MTDTTTSSDRWIGRTFKNAYRIDSLIGTGAMGSVYRAVQLAVGRPVAVKILRTDDLPEKARTVAAQRFHREAHATSRLNHPNTVRLIDFGETDEGDLFLVLELLQGRTLADRIDDEGALGSVKAARVGRQIAKSLAEAHSLDIVHRDLKPDNIYLSEFEGESDFVKVVDFGIARMVDPSQDAGQDKPVVRMTGERTLLGSPVYMSPEQAEGADKVGPPSDLYSLGIVLYECLTGEPPFDSDSYLDIVIKHLNEQPKPMELPPMPAQIETAWRALIQGLLSKDPEERPPNATAVADRLEAILELEREAKRNTSSGLHPGLGTHITRLPTDVLMAADPDASRRRRRGLVGGLLAAAAAVAIILLATGGGESTTVYKIVPPAAQGLEKIETESNAALEEAPVLPTPPAPVESDEPAAPAHLELATRPAGALVVRGDTIVCTTPCSLDVEPSDGDVTLHIRKDGFVDTPVEVRLVSGAFIDKTLVLAPDPAAQPEPKADARAKARAERRAKKRKTKKHREKKEPKKVETPTKKLLPGFRKDGPKRTERD